tara:strand:+ start:1755 stop:2222 length:468 start_codon:yes stop_codon:yes gene_type:complete
MLNEHTHYLHGNLGRDWSMKVIESTGKTVYENSLAYSLKKDDDTIWVRLTIWEDSRDGSTELAEEIADKTSKGSRVIVRGRFLQSSYKGQDGQTKTGWSCSVWDVANMIRLRQTPSNFSSGSGRLGPPDEEYKAKVKANTGIDFDEPQFPKEEPF